MSRLKVKPASDKHKAFRDDMIRVLRRHKHLPAIEMLAVASHFVGQLVALQNQLTVTPAMAMELVAKNIEAGNAEVINGISNPLGSA